MSVLNKLMYRHDIIVPIAPIVLTESLHYASSVCTVLSADMKWVPLGDQASRLEDVRPVLDDIVIAKLRPGQVRIHTCTCSW